MATQRRAGKDGGIDQNPAAADAAAFRAAMRDVRPLPQATAPSAAGRPAGAPQPRTRRKPPPSTPIEDLDRQMPLISAGASPGEQLSFRRAGVRDRQLRRLRRGLYPIEAELDLHGLDQARARELLAAFLGASRDVGRCCVRIIHGKGMRSGARGAVLKAAVDEWLRRHVDVLAFTSARPIDGGTGAVYVLLRA